MRGNNVASGFMPDEVCRDRTLFCPKLTRSFDHRAAYTDRNLTLALSSASRKAFIGLKRRGKKVAFRINAERFFDEKNNFLLLFSEI